MLYELLTGTTPFEGDTLKKVGLDELRRLIREEEPPRPSQRVCTLGVEASTTVSERRAVDGRRLNQVLKGELDWIVMRALEKDRNRRYESASAFAVDVQRYLADEAVAGVSAIGRLSAAEVRAAEPAGACYRRSDCAGTARGHGGQRVAGGGGMGRPAPGRGRPQTGRDRPRPGQDC